MINALMCVRKSADVLKYSVPQLINCPHVSKILIADGPHVGTGEGVPRDGLGPHCESPTVREYIESLSSDKIFYEYSEKRPNRAQKNNAVLKHTTDDCKWVLSVDSDEVYHEDDLLKLGRFLKANTPYDRYRIPTVDLFPDFSHRVKIGESKCRLYSYEKGYYCKHNEDRAHQFIDGPNQRRAPGSWRGMAFLSEDVCRLFHLNALRTRRRVGITANGDVVISGGNQKATSSVYSFNLADTPKTIRESGLSSIVNLDEENWDNSSLNYVD